MPHEPARPTAPARFDPSRTRVGLWLATCALSACATTPLPPSPAPAPPAARSAPQAAPAPVSTAAPQAAQQAHPPAAAPVAAAAAPAPLAPSLVQPAPASATEGEAAARLLRYADRVRGLSPAELSLEIAAIGDPGGAPERQLQLALALMHLNQPVETARALGLAQRVANSAAPDSAPLKPLARLLAQRLLEHRKIEETLDKQNAQLREQQRRIDQLNERLEAMRAIERSINNRPPAPAAPAPRAP
ncbi:MULTISPECIES: hypothetical protein [unclassified Hydrogenophaga]|uniref:hypothetical protein n=1 Tax=unclassified Hydrogenophaga TaxID=2610897 RepID=UPI00087881C6|nr:MULTISPECIES: hypothetical protein [unclassified Hydrogenophaga]MBN9369756.1 hypothetical protein [Hydrogenophaga sp.]OJV35928.1 MAG: hypothetical protein BGO22_01995 [Hydrogenophaga sp. 70-12]